MSMFYCMECRPITEQAGMCSRCPDEPLINVSNPDDLQMVDDMERSQVFRHSAKWTTVGGVGLALIGGAATFLLLAHVGVLEVLSSHDTSFSSSRRDPGGAIIIAPFAGFGVLGAYLGGRVSKRLRRRDGPASVHEAIVRFERR